MLENLCTGKQPAHHIVIEDETDAPGGPLTLTLLYSMCQRYDQVILLAVERPPQFYLNVLPAALRDKVTIPTISRPKASGERISAVSLIQAVQREIRTTGVAVGVVIDSVSSIVFTSSATVVPQLVRSLLDFHQGGSKVQQVATLVHGQVHDPSVSHVISHQADVIIKLTSAFSPQHQFSCTIRHGDPSQKPAFYTEKFNISADFSHVKDVVDVSTSCSDAMSSGDAHTQEQIDPAANLTFNLSLKPEEKAAKDQVVLPYTQMSSSENAGGLIHYVPDDDDDFDDEDPDEDLDF